MAKDARGHGSDAKGGGAFYQPTKTIPARPGTQSAAHQAGVAQATAPGINLKASAYENPVAGHQDYQEKLYRYNGTNSKAAVNWALKKAHEEWPDHRNHSVEIVE